MSNQIDITAGARVRNLNGVITGTTGVLSSVPYGGANGVATLDSSGKIPVSQLPSSVVTYLGTWNAATNTPTLVNGTGDAGDLYLCNVAGTVNFGAGPITFAIGDWVLYGSGTWQKSNGQNGTVTSVAASITGSAIGITGSPITTAGTLAFAFAGTNLQYINGAGNLTTFPSLTGYVPYTGATNDLNLGTHNLFANNLFDGFTNVAASGTQIVLTIASTPSYTITGSGGQTIKLPDATTLPNGAIFSFNNNQSSGAITINNNSNTLVVSVPSGGFAEVVLLDNSIAAGSWDRHFKAPSNVSWSTNTLDYAGSITSATWNGNVVAINRGGTGSSTQNFVDLTTTQTIGGVKTFNNGLNLRAGYYPVLIAGDTGLASSGSGLSILLKSGASVYTNNLQFSNASNDYTFPNASGTIALTSNLSSYVPYTGATTDVNLGTYAITGGIGTFTNGVLNGNGTNPANLYLKKGSSPFFTNAANYGLIAAVSSSFILISDVDGTNYKYASFNLASLTNNTQRAYTLPDASGTIALVGGSGVGTVTSVAMSVPTGLSITGSPITTSGTLAVTFTAGYSIPTNASQTTWDTAYTNRITSATSPLSIATNVISITDASASTSGVITTGTQTIAGAKTFSSAITISAINAGLNLTGATTTSSYINIANTTGQLLIGVTSSTGTFWTGGAANAYASTIGTNTNTDLTFATNNIIRLTISNSGPSTFTSSITASSFIKTSGTSSQFLKADGSVDSTAYGTGTITSVTGTAPVVSSGGTTPAISMAAATTSVNGYLSSTDWTTFNSKQGTITLTTTGTSGAATFVSNTLNIPNYGSALSGYVPYTGATTDVNLGSRALSAGNILGTTLSASQTSNSQSSLNVTNAGTFRIADFNNSGALVAYITNAGSIYGSSFVKSGGSSSQFLKADGTIDSTSYYSSGGGTITGNVYMQSSGNPSQLLAKGTNTEFWVDSQYGGGSARAFINRNGTGNQSTLMFTTGVAITNGTAWAGSVDWSMGMTNDSTSNFYIGYGDIFSASNRAITITSSRNVGIGVVPNDWYTGNSSKALQIGVAGVSIWGYGSTSNINTYLLNNAYYDSVGFKYAQSSGKASTYQQNNGVHIWSTTDSTGNAGDALSLSERMRITSGGDVHINEDGSLFTARFGIKETAVKFAQIIRHDNSGTQFFMDFKYLNTDIGNILGNNTNTIYSTISDYRLKEDFKDFNGIDLVTKLNVYDFAWKLDNTRRMYGLIAHEMAEILPYAVSGQKDDVYEDGHIKSQGVDYSLITPLLVKAIQELNQLVQELKAEIEQLKNK